LAAAGTAVTSSTSPGLSSPTTAPSASMPMAPLAGSTLSATFSPSESTSDRLYAECGATGVTTRPWVRGDTIGPPAEKLYAVDPVGVATISASAT
jgi:hypothetical protein